MTGSSLLKAHPLSIALLFVRTFFSPSTHRALARYLGTVMRDFFFLQFAVKFGLKTIPVLPVDHELDRRVPFTPSKVHLYLDFVAFWIRPALFVIRRFGWKRSAPILRSFLETIEDCYRSAASIYRFRMTTTKRPAYYKGPFLTIHLFDPHYLCVPSLHVIVVVLAYTFYRRIFEELKLDEEERKELGRQLYEGAVAITETVLLIKQHSVNCIPAALYTIGCITPKDVYPMECVRFIEDLFRHSTEVLPEDAKQIRQHIEDMYEQLLLEGCHDSDWRSPLYRWLASR